MKIGPNPHFPVVVGEGVKGRLHLALAGLLISKKLQTLFKVDMTQFDTRSEWKWDFADEEELTSSSNVGFSKCTDRKDYFDRSSFRFYNVYF